MNPEDELLIKTVREFAAREIEPLAEKIDREDWYPRELVSKLGEQGYLIPLNSNLNMFQTSLVIREIARASGSVALIQDAQGELAGETIRAFGNEEQKRKYLEPMSRGELIGAFGLSEPCCGSDAAALQTMAVKKGGEWIINGKKMWTTQGLYADVYIIFARTGKPEEREKAITAFIVPRGSCIETNKIEVMGFRGTGTAEVTLNECHVGDENVLGEVNGGWKIIKHTLNVGRIAISAIALGLAERALEEAIEWAKSRLAFGSPLIKFEGLRWYIAESSAYLMSMFSLLENVSSKFPNVSDAQISSLKYVTAKEANRIVDVALQIMGGMGYAKGTKVERIYRDIRLTRIGEGTDEVQLMIISKFLEREGIDRLLEV